MGQTTAAGAFGKFNNAHVLLNAVDLSSFVRQLSVSIDGLSEEEISAMGDTIWAKFTHGRSGVQITASFWQGYYTAEVHETIEAIIEAAVDTTLAYNPEGSSTSATNKRYTWTGQITNYTQGGDYDANMPAEITFRPTGAPTIATS